MHDPEDPYKLDAQANSWTPPLNQSWDWARNRINGVNVGGLFVLEPFISPAIFQKYPGTHDEWELSAAIMAANGNLDELEEHYRTFYVRAMNTSTLLASNDVPLSDRARYRRNCWYGCRSLCFEGICLMMSN